MLWSGGSLECSSAAATDGMAATYFDSQAPGDAGDSKRLSLRFSDLWSILITLGGLMTVANATFQPSRDFGAVQIVLNYFRGLPRLATVNP